jgi:CDP-ribitol ribitolphosphotransferase
VTLVLVLGRIWLVRIAFFAARLRPIGRRVVLATSHASRIEGNLACIRAELERRRPAVAMTVLAYRASGGFGGVLLTALNEIRAAYYLATARAFIVDDYFFPIYAIRPRAGTTIIQAWHACGAFKKFGHSVLGQSFGAERALTRRVQIHGNYDVCLVSSRAAAVCYAEAFRQPLERFKWDLGIPRTDLLFGDQRTAVAAQTVRRHYGIPTDRRVVLYAPTFRGERTTAARHPQDLDLRVLRSAIGDDHVLLVRLHPFVRAGFAVDADLAGFAIDVSDHPEVNELMLVSDVLITDYSSVIFEFALLGRPIILFAPDHEQYEKERGFYFDYRAEGPGPVFEDTAALADYLKAGEFDEARVERFRSHWLEVADGNSTRRFVDQIVVPSLNASQPAVQHRGEVK